MNRKSYIPVRIFIATPGDLQAERNALIDVVSEINIIKAHHLGFHLEVLGWEQTLPGNGRPQELINKDIQNCDLFLMALWKHWGTPSGRYSSGTEEEYYVATNLYDSLQRPEIWLFFKDPCEGLQDCDPIVKFRKTIEEKREIFYHQFKTTMEWQNMIRIFLCRWLEKFEDSFYPDKTTQQKIMSSIDTKILYRITYQDWIGSGCTVDPIIFFTLEDELSFSQWKKMTQANQKQYIYDLLSDNLGLILGANPYLAQMRYKCSDTQFILLATISRKYEDSLSQSRIFIPRDFSHLCSKSKLEVPFEGYI